MRSTRLLTATICVAATALLFGATRQAVELRNRGLAELENERPAEAEATYRELQRLAKGDPLPAANLAIALLRQQKIDEALAATDEALRLATDRPDLLALRGDVLQWGGRIEEALPVYRKAADAAPEDVEIQYSLYRAATSLSGPAAEEAAKVALERLAALRPENTVILLQRGRRAIERGDRATASGAFLRIQELLWQAPPIAVTAMELLRNALEGADLAAARTPSQRLENVLKITPMYQQGLRELNTGIQGLPVSRFTDEPAPESFGDPVPLELRGRRIGDGEAAGRGLVAGFFDDDQRVDLAWLRRTERGSTIELQIGGSTPLALPAGRATELVATDLDNDGVLDLLAVGPFGSHYYRGDGSGGFAEGGAAFGLDRATGDVGATFDFDIEGDLDVALARPGKDGLTLWRNNLAGSLERFSGEVFGTIRLTAPHSLLATDLDRDGDLDLLVADGDGLRWLDNLRQGTFIERADSGLGALPGLAAATSADLDGDGFPEVVAAGPSVGIWHNRLGRFERLPGAVETPAGVELTAVVAADLDNDGRLDLAFAGPSGVLAYAQRSALSFERVAVSGGPSSAVGLVAFDLDADGDLDLVASGNTGLHRLDNAGGNRNRWLAVRLRGLDQGSSKNNILGLGATLEVSTGTAYQFREAQGQVTHFGLGSQRRADVLRVEWTNGVPQNRLALAGNQLVVEEQLLKGSCPFLYTWDGERFAFVTDLLWGAPLGLPLAPDVWSPADPGELVRIDGAAASSGRLELRITEELWEAAFFDRVRLWVVDHPADVEVASNLRILPGTTMPERVLASRALRPVAAAWDGEGREVTARLRERDDVYADGYRRSRYQGVAEEPWSLTFDLGETPNAPVRLHLDGWIFPADASLNLAVAQRPAPPPLLPRLEVETASGWQPLVEHFGFPAGKTKTMVVDLPPLPPGAHRLRLVTGLWLSWDRIAWTTRPVDAAATIVAQLQPAGAELRYRGFSRLLRKAPNAPHHYDYSMVRTASPWRPFPGFYTRYGDVLPLLENADDRTVVVGPGDEIAVAFDLHQLPAPPAGSQRTFFLESFGWDKDADRNTYEPNQVGPLPFAAMSGYPWTEEESYPQTPALQHYQKEWLTRQVGTPGGDN